MAFSAFMRLRHCSFIHQMDFLLVRNHVPVPRERFAAHVTVMVLDPGVRDHVSRQVARRQKAFVAHGADLITDSRVNFLVRLEVPQRRKLLGTHFALKRTLAGMSTETEFQRYNRPIQ